jgi:hypothetical protein
MTRVGRVQHGSPLGQSDFWKPPSFHGSHSHHTPITLPCHHDHPIAHENSPHPRADASRWLDGPPLVAVHPVEEVFWKAKKTRNSLLSGSGMDTNITCPVEWTEDKTYGCNAHVGAISKQSRNVLREWKDVTLMRLVVTLPFSK